MLILLALPGSTRKNSYHWSNFILSNRNTATNINEKNAAAVARFVGHILRRLVP